MIEVISNREVNCKNGWYLILNNELLEGSGSFPPKSLNGADQALLSASDFAPRATTGQDDPTRWMILF